MQTFTIKPKTSGLLVRDPESRKPLKPEGEEKPRNTYWLRRIKDQSVVEVKAKTSVKKDTKQ